MSNDKFITSCFLAFNTGHSKLITVIDYHSVFELHLANLTNLLNDLTYD